MDYQHIVKQLEKTSHQTVEYLSNRSNLKEIGKITAISVATYVVANVKRQKKFWLHKCSDCHLGRNYTTPTLGPWAISLVPSGVDSLNSPSFITTSLTEQGNIILNANALTLSLIMLQHSVTRPSWASMTNTAMSFAWVPTPSLLQTRIWSSKFWLRMISPKLPSMKSFKVRLISCHWKSVSSEWLTYQFFV